MIRYLQIERRFENYAMHDVHYPLNINIILNNKKSLYNIYIWMAVLSKK